MVVELLETRVTSLELTADAKAGRRRISEPVEGMRIEQARRLPVARYRELYVAVGAVHHWTSRLLSDKTLAAEIHGPRIRIFLASIGQDVVGWFEIELKHEVREARIVHFAVLPKFRRRGLSGPLIEAAIEAGFEDGPDRLTIETNTLDHPAAFSLYVKHGFTPYATRQVKTPTYGSIANTKAAAQ